MRKKDTQIRSLAGVLLLLFLSYFANISLFQHTHIINGVTIVHSHLHSSHHSDTPSGGHSANDLTLISALSDYRMEAAMTFDLSEVFRPITLFRLVETPMAYYPSFKLKHAPFRGPPIHPSIL